MFRRGHVSLKRTYTSYVTCFFLFHIRFLSPIGVIQMDARGFGLRFFGLFLLTVRRFALQVCSLGTLSGVSLALRAHRASGARSPPRAMRVCRSDASRTRVRAPPSPSYYSIHHRHRCRLYLPIGKACVQSNSIFTPHFTEASIISRHHTKHNAVYSRQTQHKL